MINKQDIRVLLEQYLTGTINREDLVRLKQVIDDPSYSEVLDELSDELMELRLKETYSFPEAQQRVKQQVLQQIRPALRPVRRSAILVRAAAVLLLLGGGVTWWYMNSRQQAAPSSVAVNSEKDISAGRNGALLTLADGKVISLDSLANGIVATQKGANAVLKDGSLSYEGTAASGNTDLVYNTVTTPKGRQFQLVLPDGTHVWLNAGSSIRYPTAFAANERKVSITGEAYFEVTGNALAPFRVSTKEHDEVQVLGTSFNISAYEDDNDSKTTLLEGAIRVSANQKSLLLQPGQQAKIDRNKNGDLQLIANPDLGKVIAWKNGYFNFENTNLKDAMRELARWYDLEVVYEGEAPDIEFVGKISRSLSLKSALKVLERAGVHFRLEGRKLVVLAA
ncbi:FecR family protein [Chitinophaga terrae (ex Kim and Jung 2007)]|uniref:FecR family protein n=1 Tax=Chitinophaga terrae (ex Kim and Jung 2007) TaxID=408074 RepID=A0A1H4EVT1_9BACT|nr:FecR family protein [Chitinophaga terrae (ex Kim and Jung 2007)]GEP91851.1 iron dicitrate transporter FecR [Chitinophaga terrae (ex Kim and Jung 2007)]SEA88352.1 FecR family protein [Chitinophaga terrae (ex Kim and Jung 2007)]